MEVLDEENRFRQARIRMLLKEIRSTNMQFSNAKTMIEQTRAMQLLMHQRKLLVVLQKEQREGAQTWTF